MVKSTMMTPEANNHRQGPMSTGRASKKAGDRLRGVSEVVLLPTELLVDIFRHLPATQLLVMQRVCRRFRNVITETTSIQERLFLAPAEGLCWNYMKSMYDRQSNVPFSEEGCGVGTGMPSSVLIRSSRRGFAVPPVSVLNPILFTLRGGQNVSTRNGPAWIGWRATMNRSEPPTPDCSEASWRRMFVTQPPMEIAEVSYRVGLTDYEVEGKDGVKAGDVVDFGRRLEKRWHEKIPWQHIAVDFEEDVILELDETPEN